MKTSSAIRVLNGNTRAVNRLYIYIYIYRLRNQIYCYQTPRKHLMLRG